MHQITAVPQFISTDFLILNAFLVILNMSPVQLRLWTSCFWRLQHIHYWWRASCSASIQCIWSFNSAWYVWLWSWDSQRHSGNCKFLNFTCLTDACNFVHYFWTLLSFQRFCMFNIKSIAVPQFRYKQIPWFKIVLCLVSL